MDIGDRNIPFSALVKTIKRTSLARWQTERPLDARMWVTPFSSSAFTVVGIDPING